MFSKLLTFLIIGSVLTLGDFKSLGKSKKNEKSCSELELYVVAKTWTEAHETCIKDGGHLVVVNSKDEEEALYRMVKNARSKLEAISPGFSDTVWIGINAWNQDDEWRTVTGESLNDLNHVMMWVSDSDPYNDDVIFGTLRVDKKGLENFSGDRKFGFVCEKRTVCQTEKQLVKVAPEFEISCGRPNSPVNCFKF